MPESRKTIGELLLELVMYPPALKKYREDRQNYLGESGLEPRKQEILLAGDLSQILDELVDEYGPTPTGFMPPDYIPPPDPPEPEPEPDPKTPPREPKRSPT